MFHLQTLQIEIELELAQIFGIIISQLLKNLLKPEIIGTGDLEVRKRKTEQKKEK